MHLTNNIKPRVESQLFSLDSFVQPTHRVKLSTGLKDKKFFLEEASRILGVSIFDLKNSGRHVMVRKRHAVIYVMKYSLGKSTVQIRNIMGLRNNTNVYDACFKSSQFIQDDPAFASMIDALEMVA